MKNKLSAEKYIRTKAGSLPFGECYVNETWKEKGMAVVFVSRIMPSGKFIIGVYNVDIFCLGLKDTLYRFALDDFERREFLKRVLDGFGNILPLEPNQAHNIIYGAVDYAEELGFKPHKDFKLTEYLLDPDLIDDGIDEIEFGMNGKPHYISGPFDNAGKILEILNRTAGEGNYYYTIAEH